MGAKSQIEWCDSTLNFWSGCTKVSPGCTHCYAETLSNRKLGTPGRGGAIGKWGPKAQRKIHEPAFKEAFRLNRKPWVCENCGRGSDRHYDHSCTGRKEDACHTSSVKWHRRRIFSLSLGDWLDCEVPTECLARMLDTIRQCHDVRWLLLTKRPELWQTTLKSCLRWIEQNDCKFLHDGCSSLQLRNWLADWVVLGRAPQQVAVGVSVEDQQRADERIPALLRIPAASRFLSCEPLLGPVDLKRVRWRTQDDHHGNPQPDHFENVLVGGGAVQVPKVDWVIVGGESGSQARPCHVEWVRSLVRQGQASGVAVFVKQLGARCADRNDRGYEGDSGPSGWPMDTDTLDCLYPGEWQGKEVMLKLKDRHRKGSDPAEWPEDLRVREFPEVLR